MSQLFVANNLSMRSPRMSLITRLCTVLAISMLLCKLLLLSHYSQFDNQSVLTDQPIRRFIYIPPPKTGSMVTREQLRRFCVDENLNCLGQSWPCAHIEECTMNNANVSHQLRFAFWAAFTRLRLEQCCPKMKAIPHYDANLFHLYLADADTKRFMHEKLHPDSAFKFTFIRHPVDQFISFFNFVTKSHRKLYGRYIELVDKKPKLEATVNYWHSFVVRGHESGMPKDYQQLYATLQNVQSRVLGWDGTQLGVHVLLAGLQSDYQLVCLSEHLAECWQHLRTALRWSPKYLPQSRLANMTTTRYNITDSLRRKIEDIQQTDMMLYERAKSVYDHYAKQHPLF